MGVSPFDIYFAESEIVGGPFVEYSGAHFSVFFLAEYINTFLVGALTALFFLGGWYGPFLPEWMWFLLKTYAVVVVIFWIRGTFPRLRVDQLMAFRLEGDDSPLLRGSGHLRRLPLLRLARVDHDRHVSSRFGCGRILAVSKIHPAGAAVGKALWKASREGWKC